MAKGMHSSNYCTIFGWMLNELQLSGNELLVYAIIYGFSQDGESRYKGGRGYLANTLNISKPTVDKALRSLTDKGYIQRTEVAVNGVQFVEYSADLGVIAFLYGEPRNLPTPCKETCPPPVKKLAHPCKETLSSNNIEKTNIEKIEGKYKNSETAILLSVSTIANNEELFNAFMDFVKMRKKMRKPMTERALQLLVNRCFKLSGGDAGRMIKILDRSICKGWQDVYPWEDDSTSRTGDRLSVTDNPFTAIKKAEGRI